jgi:hypothetical protein
MSAHEYPHRKDRCNLLLSPTVCIDSLPLLLLVLNEDVNALVNTNGL